MFFKTPLPNSNVVNDYKEIDWTFIGYEGANFRSHTVLQKSNILVVKPRFIFLVIVTLVPIIGFFLIFIDGFEFNKIFNDQNLMPKLIGIAFFFAGLVGLISHSRNIKYFNKGKNSYSTMNKIECKLSDIKFIQLLYTRAMHRGINRDSRSIDNAFDYQINLVLNTNKRINVVSQGGLTGIRKDANKIGEFLNVPVLDGINDDYINNSYFPVG